MNATTRAWKDPVYRATLDDSELGALSTHPLGAVDLDGSVLDGVYGARTEAHSTTGCCGTVPLTTITCFTCHHWTCRTCWGC
jgi:mersacidin/lichenicidin family type 2 lantibiotic